VSPYFSIAAGFGNVHGVYSPGNVKLRPELLQKHQEYVAEKIGVAKDSKPVYLVFHGGSGSSVDDFRQAISYGVVKVNLDTDMQWAYLSGVRDFVQVLRPARLGTRGRKNNDRESQDRSRGLLYRRQGLSAEEKHQYGLEVEYSRHGDDGVIECEDEVSVVSRSDSWIGMRMRQRGCISTNGT
jgi:hypothetical protein